MLYEVNLLNNIEIVDIYYYIYIYVKYLTQIRFNQNNIMA